MALVLVTGAALMIRSFSKIMAIDVGFEPGAMVTMEVVPVDAHPAARGGLLPRAPPARAPDPRHRRRGRGRAGPAGWQRFIHRRNRQWAFDKHRPQTRHARVLRSDRLAAASGAVSNRRRLHGGPPFAVLSESAARAIFPDRPAVGQQFVLQKKSWTVVGVVGNARNKSPLIQDRERPDLYLAHQPDESSVRRRPDGRGPPGGPDSATRGAASSRGTCRRSFGDRGAHSFRP